MELIFAVFCSCVALWLASLWISVARKRALPPGSLGWPILGETIEFLTSRASLISCPFLDKRLKQYGSFFKSHLFGQQLIVSADPAINQFILENEGVLFQSCLPINRFKRMVGTQTLSGIHGEQHAMIRKAVIHVLREDRLKVQLFEAIQNAVLKQLPSWQDQIVHVQNEGSYIILSLVLHCLLNQDPEDMELQKLHKYCGDYKSILVFPFNIPVLGYSKHAQGRDKLINYFEEKISKRRSSGISSSEDLLGVLLKLEENGKSLGSELIMEVVIGITLHAKETASIAMALLLKFLSKSPELLKNVIEENISIRKTRGKTERLC